jgi:hypothetical protein
MTVEQLILSLVKTKRDDNKQKKLFDAIDWLRKMELIKKETGQLYLNF